MNDNDYKLLSAQLRDSSNQLASTTGVVQAVYFAAISFSSLNTVMSINKSWYFYIPMFCWLLTLVMCLLVLIPDNALIPFKSPDKQRQKRLTWRKSVWITASILFFIGLNWMSVAMIIYLFVLQLPPPT